MSIQMKLDALKMIVGSMSISRPVERVQMYVAISTLLNELETEENVPNFHSYSKELLWSCASLAGLDEGNGHNDTQHTAWAYCAINKLASKHCLNV